MKKKLTTVVFEDTPEKADKLAALISEYKDVEGSLMPVLQGAQDIYGYLPIEVQKKIAEGLGLSLSEVYGAMSRAPANFMKNAWRSPASAPATFLRTADSLMRRRAASAPVDSRPS